MRSVISAAVLAAVGSNAAPQDAADRRITTNVLQEHDNGLATGVSADGLTGRD